MKNPPKAKSKGNPEILTNNRPIMKEAPTRKHLLLRAVLSFSLFISVISLYELVWPVYQSGILFASRRWMVVLSLALALICLEVLLLIVAFSRQSHKIFRTLEAAAHAAGRLRWLNLLLYAALTLLYVFTLFGPLGLQVQNLSLRLFLFWALALLGSFLMKAWSLGPGRRTQRSWGEFLCASLVIGAFSHQVASFVPSISTYPFTLGWSETSRYYYASLYISRRIYGISVPPTVLHPSRYLMQAIPFLLPNSPLWLHRAWQVLLWIVTPSIAALALIRRLSIGDRLRYLLLLLWMYLFIMLGPVYYHLLVPVIIVLWGFKTDQPDPRSLRSLRSIVAVLLASAWAGISRINWFPVPGMVAAALYLLEQAAYTQDTPARSWKSMARYLIAPLFWCLVGSGAAFAAQALYIWWSGNPPGEFTTSFSSDLLWYRLLPNKTYPPGILPGALLVSFPLFLLILGKMLEQRGNLPAWRSYHPLRLLGLAAILLVLLVGGLVVSVKIGGGSNLHNLDAYLMLLLVITAYIFFDKAIPDWQVNTTGLSLAERPTGSAPDERRDRSRRRSTAILQTGLVLAVLIPVGFTLISRAPESASPEEKYVDKGLKQLVNLAQSVSQAGGEVLFISNRHLLTFHYIENVELIPDYERVYLMEMAMAGHSEYLDKFREDLKNQRFGLIVSEPLYTQQKDESAVFGEENNAWVNQVSQYILCYYEEEKLARQVHIQLLIPKKDVEDCP